MRGIGNILQNISCGEGLLESPIEGMFFNALMDSRRFILVKHGEQPQGEGFFIFPQYEVGNFRADFIIKAYGWNNEPRVWPPKRQVTICVECDGAEFHKDKARDKARDAYFKTQGIETIRFTGSTIHKMADWCVKHVIEHLENALWRAE